MAARTQSAKADLTRTRARVALVLCGALLAAGCGWFGPTIELPKDIPEAASNPAIGSRALLRANQTELEIATWQPAVQSLVDALGDQLDATHAEPLRSADTARTGPAAVRPRGDQPGRRLDADAALAQFHSGQHRPESPARARVRRDEKTAARLEWSRDFRVTLRRPGSRSCTSSTARCSPRRACCRNARSTR
jgi:hypothetical protein